MAIIKKNKPFEILEKHQKTKEFRVLNFNETGKNRLQVKKVFIKKNESFPVISSSTEINWTHTISGNLDLGGTTISNEKICFIPANYKTSFKAKSDSILLICTINNYERFEKEKIQQANDIKIVNWKNEPVLKSKHDNRKRIYVATKNLWNTDAVKGEIILYPLATRAPAHHHKGAEHFQYVLSGEGLAFVEGQAIPLEAGDLIYFFENELHWFENKNSELFSFVEFFIPGSYTTVWEKPRKTCTWIPTNKNIIDGIPCRKIISHRSDEEVEI